MVNRFPNSFSHGWVGLERNTIIITANEISELLNKRIELIVPAIYSKLMNILEPNQLMSFEELKMNYDFRMSYNVLESIVAKYPDQFSIVSTYSNGLFYQELMRMK